MGKRLFFGTVGSITEEIIKEYIEKQDKKDIRGILELKSERFSL